MWSSHNTSSRPKEDKKTQEYFSCVSLCLGFRVSDRYLGYQKRERQKKTDVFFERLLNDAASLYKTAFVCFPLSLLRNETHILQKTNVSRSCRTVVLSEEEEEEELVFDWV